MLKNLSISQFVIIDHLDIDFSGGLTVLTGETGAGKSILLDALGLMLGDDADVESVRQGAQESVIEANFDPPPQHPVWAFLAKREGMEVTGPILNIRRTIPRHGNEEIMIGPYEVDLPFLKELGPYLVEIHGQFANQNFLAAETQLTLLDAYGAYPPGTLENVAEDWETITHLMKEMDEEKTFLATAEREKKSLEQAVSAIEKTKLQKDTYAELKTELTRLTEARDICDIFHTINAQLVAQSGVEMILTRITHALNPQGDPALDTLKLNVKTALEQTRAAISELQILSPKYLDVDTSGIHEVEKALDGLKALAVANKVRPDELYARYEYMAARLKRIQKAPTHIRELDEQLIKTNESYRQHAHTLSEARGRVALKLSEEINAEMTPLRLLSAQMRIEVTENLAKRTARGYNDVVFTARMNPGMPFSPIAKTASGGELARLILALKMILQRVQIVSTLVFDEIDTGIGGAAAAAVGSRIANLARSTQVLVITHSPQVASRGNQHMHVSKQTDGTSTHTIVDMLTREQRIDEISRMLAGEELTGESRAAAETLLEEARTAAARADAAQPTEPPAPTEIEKTESSPE